MGPTLDPLLNIRGADAIGVSQLNQLAEKERRAAPREAAARHCERQWLGTGSARRCNARGGGSAPVAGKEAYVWPEFFYSQP
ncbi:hypothetical protein PR202_ga09501 [Eleusine coracana subsp. coracana]|uniref:Uncharacterized protein n=1 Tax=Eleusine coracana subsp. coracana TaxID=191504 RepID=A0AAV5C3B2_ELECO|nr:hypothetical protein PR202_ga09501 [Eleusine coracana subsp. coracana]